MLVGPFISISQNYQIFREVGTKQFTGFGLFLLGAFLIVGSKALMGKVKMFPENTYTQRIIKFSFYLIYQSFLPVIAFFILYALHDNFEVAFDTIRSCLIYFSIGIIFDNLFVKFLESERNLRTETQKDVEKEKRKHLFT